MRLQKNSTFNFWCHPWASKYLFIQIKTIDTRQVYSTNARRVVVWDKPGAKGGIPAPCPSKWELCPPKQGLCPKESKRLGPETTKLLIITPELVENFARILQRRPLFFGLHYRIRGEKFLCPPKKLFMPSPPPPSHATLAPGLVWDQFNA